MSEEIPTSIGEAEIAFGDIKVKVHILSDGRRVIEAADMARLMNALECTEIGAEMVRAFGAPEGEPPKTRISAYFFGRPGDAADQAVKHIFEQHGGKHIGSGTMMAGHNAGERDVMYDVPDDRAEACRSAIVKIGLRLQPAK